MHQDLPAYILRSPCRIKSRTVERRQAGVGVPVLILLWCMMSMRSAVHSAAVAAGGQGDDFLNFLKSLESQRASGRLSLEQQQFEVRTLLRRG